MRKKVKKEDGQVEEEEGAEDGWDGEEGKMGK